MAANTRRVLALLLAFVAVDSGAATATVADLDAVQGETLMLRAEAAREKAKQERDELRGGSRNNDAQAGIPTARGLFGANGKRYVVFLYPNGGMAEGGVGDPLPGGYRVLAFDSTGVDLRASGGKRHRIPFSNQAPTPAAPAASNQPAYPTPGVVPPVTTPPLR